jgi:hypothetical protein
LVFGREVVDWSGLMGLVCFLELLVGSPPAIEDDFLKKKFYGFSLILEWVDRFWVFSYGFLIIFIEHSLATSWFVAILLQSTT